MGRSRRQASSSCRSLPTALLLGREAVGFDLDKLQAALLADWKAPKGTLTITVVEARGRTPGEAAPCSTARASVPPFPR